MAAVVEAAAMPWPRHRQEGDEEGAATAQGGWARPRRKRSRRHLLAPTEEEHLALCLLMLAPGHRDASPPARQEHRCSVCGKAFSSHQALGGHKSSHRVRPAAASAAAPAKPVAFAAQEPVAPAAASPAASSSAAGSSSRAAHECSVCRKTFPSGQALGGHKRCHYEGAGGSVSTASGLCRGFDLNVPALPVVITADGCMPAAEEEEEEVLSPLAFKKPRLMILA
ncbi:unnamed protein product [Urochloa decumbens]|uniref:C2H2-type domain-containing protein n=1 Tax=Urochloa decumbens TaxID=240449 RepID=A0ABC8YIZ1_9POAL